MPRDIICRVRLREAIASSSSSPPALSRPVRAVGQVVVVCGESGAGKTSFVETILERWPQDERLLWGACDPLATPRPLGPVHDLAEQLATPVTREVLRGSEHPYEIFAAVFDRPRCRTDDPRHRRSALGRPGHGRHAAFRPARASTAPLRGENGCGTRRWRRASDADAAR